MSLTIPQVRLPEIPCHRSVVLAQQMVQNVHASARHDVPIVLLFWQVGFIINLSHEQHLIPGAPGLDQKVSVWHGHSHCALAESDVHESAGRVASQRLVQGKSPVSRANCDLVGPAAGWRGPNARARRDRLAGQATGLCGGQFCLWHPGPGYFHRSRVVRLAAVPVLSATAKNLTGAVGEDNHCHAMAVEQEVQNSAIEQEDPPMSLYVRIALLSLEPPRCVAGCNLEWPPCHHLSPYDVCRLIPLEAWQRQQPCYLEPRD